MIVLHCIGGEVPDHLPHQITICFDDDTGNDLFVNPQMWGHDGRVLGCGLNHGAQVHCLQTQVQPARIGSRKDQEFLHDRLQPLHFFKEITVALLLFRPTGACCTASSSSPWRMVSGV